MTLRQSVFSVLLVAAFFVLPGATNAMVSTDGNLLLVSPVSPQANQTITVTLSDPTAVLPGGSLQWFVDGVERTADQNRSGISLQTRGIGEESEVKAVITNPGGSVEATTMTIEPIRLDLIVGANSRVPSFYSGRALPSGSSQIAVSAQLFGAGAGPFNYEWFVNGQRHTGTVGNTSETVTFRPGLDYEMTAEVYVYSRQGTLLANDSVRIPLTKPELHFYEANPLRGLMPNALRTPYYFLNDEITLRAEPYFFSSTANDLAITWKIDGSKTTPDADPLELTITKTVDSGTAMVGIDIIDRGGYVDTAATDLEVTF